MRLRGSLFFGPAFLVTRNKLTFRDNLQELLASSSPGLVPLTCQVEELCLANMHA